MFVLSALFHYHFCKKPKISFFAAFSSRLTFAIMNTHPVYFILRIHKRPKYLWIFRVFAVGAWHIPQIGWDGQTLKYCAAFSLSLVAILLFRETHALAGPADLGCLSRAMRTQTDKTVPSGLPASLVWLTAYTEIFSVVSGSARCLYRNTIGLSRRRTSRRAIAIFYAFHARGIRTLQDQRAN